MEVNVLFQLGDLFRFRWDPAILAILGDHPARFRALHAELQGRVEEHVDDNALTRSLYRLRRKGFVNAQPFRVGLRSVHVYSITHSGSRRLTTYDTLIAAFQRPDCQAGTQPWLIRSDSSSE